MCSFAAKSVSEVGKRRHEREAMAELPDLLVIGPIIFLRIPKQADSAAF
jgi:hypothetical protein